MTATKLWEQAESARRTADGATTRRRDLEERLQRTTACLAQTRRERNAIEAQITQAVSSGDADGFGAAFRGELATLRGDCERLTSQAAGLEKLLRVVAGEERRLVGVAESCHATLLDRDGSGVYTPEVRTLLAERGIVCLGHTVTLIDADDESAFTATLTGADTAVERAVRGKRVGDTVSVHAPGGAYTCRVKAIRTDG